ncbi:hypothetical protein O6P43_002294 [Quillaja saponaria]|uniref:Uncharacterized protein n=1 Tax=Quillaja saponaria TaxID=32244 RepID=A0AAD7QC54_QUISA|nr:hypothetical protein O6P43_002294 [Quillaja saponaria]
MSPPFFLVHLALLGLNFSWPRAAILIRKSGGAALFLDPKVDCGQQQHGPLLVAKSLLTCPVFSPLVVELLRTFFYNSWERIREEQAATVGNKGSLLGHNFSAATYLVLDSLVPDPSMSLMTYVSARQNDE